MDYVNETSASRAREWEGRFQALPPMAGVIFVGVEALPTPDGVSTIYEVRLGLSKKYDVDTGLALIKNILEEEVESGEFTINVAVYRGVPGTCHEGDARPGTPPS